MTRRLLPMILIAVAQFPAMAGTGESAESKTDAAIGNGGRGPCPASIEDLSTDANPSGQAPLGWLG